MKLNFESSIFKKELIHLGDTEEYIVRGGRDRDRVVRGVDAGTVAVEALARAAARAARAVPSGDDGPAKAARPDCFLPCPKARFFRLFRCICGKCPNFLRFFDLGALTLARNAVKSGSSLIR